MGDSQRVLVTGASGFVGGHLLAHLNELGAEAYALGRRPPAGLDPARALSLSDAGDGAAVAAALLRVRPAAVVHMAGTPHAHSPEALYRVNVLFAARLCEAALAMDPRPRLLLLGSAAEYGPVAEPDLPVTEETPCRPTGAYGTTKLAQTLLGLAAATAGLPVVVARLFNPVGRGMPDHLALGSVARQLRAAGSEGGELVTGELDVERDFTDVRDVVRTLAALALRPDIHGVFDVCSGRPTSLRILVEALVALSGRAVALHTDPARGGVSAQRRHFGAGRRLAALGLAPPPASPTAVAAAILGLEEARCRPDAAAPDASWPAFDPRPERNA